MSDEEIDPEVLADLQLRAATERDPSRMREMPTWKPATIVDRVPCRGRCGAVVEWSDEAEHAFETWNRILLAKREAPLDKTRIVFCNACRAKGAQIAADANRKRVDAMAVAIRELKGGAAGERERELYALLEKLHHPDIAGLREWIRQQREKQPGRRARRSEVTS